MNNLEFNETSKSKNPNPIEDIIAELNERKRWAENGLLIYSDGSKNRLEYLGRIEEIENAILIVSQYSK